MTSYEATGKTLDEAIRAGLSAMGVERDAVSVEVLEKPKSGFFGLLGTQARVRLTLADSGPSFTAPVERSVIKPPSEQRPVKPQQEKVWKKEKPAKQQAAPQPAPQTPQAVQQTVQSAPKPKPVPKPAAQAAPQTASQVAPKSAQQNASHASLKPAKQPTHRKSSDSGSAAKRDEHHRSQHSGQKQASKQFAGPRHEKEGRGRQERMFSPATPEQEKTALAFITGLMEQMKTGVTSTSRIDQDGVICLTLEGESLGNLIGRRGDTLDAIQHLVAHVVNVDPANICRVHVDAADYRSKRQEALERLAHRMAENSIKYRNNMVLEPMNAYERHIIHVALQDVAGVTTYSQGVEPQRRVVIAFQGSRDGGRRQFGARRGDGNRPPHHRHRDNQDRQPREPRPERQVPNPQPPAAPPSPRSLPVKEFGIKRVKED